MIDTSQKTRITTDLEENTQVFDKMFGNGESFDCGSRTFIYRERKARIFYVNGLIDSDAVMQVMTSIGEINESLRFIESIEEAVVNQFVNQSVEFAEDYESAAVKVLSGLLVMFVDGFDKAIIADIRSYPGRGPAEPDTEKVVRGSRDGFTENIIMNTALIRRRIRDNRLRYQMYQIGTNSKTDVCVAYLDGVANPKIVQEVVDKVKAINVDGLSMSDKTVEEFVFKQGYNPFPYGRYTERPDVASAHLLEGNVLIMVDTSPSIVIAPVTYWHHCQHAEEFRQVPIVGTFLRWARYIGIFLSIFLLPIWLTYCLSPELLPEGYKYIGPNNTNNIPLVVQVLIADISFEFLRMAAIHTPTAVSTAMGLVAGTLIGSIAIDVGYFVPEVVLYTSVAAIGSFATPSYELGLANKMVKIVLILLVAAFKEVGLLIGSTLLVMYLVHLKSLSVPYFWPIIPFQAEAFKRIVFRVKVPGNNTNPSVNHSDKNSSRK